MWKAIKGLPVVAKVVIGFVLVAGIYRASQANSYSHAPYERAHYPVGNEASDGASSTGTEEASVSEQDPYHRRSDAGSDSAGQGEPNGAAAQQLAQFKQQQAQLMRQVQQCEAEMTQATNAMAAAAMQGGMVNNRPQCEQYMPQWVAQEAYLETEIYRLQTGDRHSSLREITGIPPDRGSSAGSGRAGARDDGTGSVEDWDRGAIRGTSIYTDAEGGQHELPTRPYYFRDRATGAFVGSDQPYAPNDGHDYEQLQGGGE